MNRFFRILVLLFAVSISSAFAQKTYKIGDYYNDGTKEGVVFWVDKTGTKGKIVSLDQSKLEFCTSLLLDDDGEWITISTNETNGKVNTDNVMDSEDRSDYPVFIWCRNMGKDWYLPAIEEIKLFLLNDNVHDAVNKTLKSRGKETLSNRGESVRYWSSTEDIYSFDCGVCAYYVSMLNGRVDSQVVYHVYHVRAVAIFDASEISTSIATYTYETKPVSPNTSASVPTAPKTYKVGDYYNDGSKEGVVFWVDATGKHGKIVSMQQTSASWSSDEVEQKCYIGALSKTDGEANMKVIMGRPNWKANYPAFAWCANLGEGWYLPAIDELEKFTLNDAVRNAVNRTLAAKSGAKLSNVSSSKVMWYWSSTEREYQYPNREYSAQLISMDAATIGRARKSVQGPTRAVAQF